MAQKMIRISEVVSISVGLPLMRKRVSNDAIKGIEYQTFSLKNIRTTDVLSTQLLDTFQSRKTIHKKYLSQEGQIVMSQLYPYTAFYITKEFEGIVVPENFLLLSIKENKILYPEYLVSVLNNQKTQYKLKRLALSVMIPKILKRDLETLKIPIISHEKQQLLAEFNRLSNEKERLLKEMLENQQVLREQVNRNILNY
ncbi:MAG TPA: hypothetical protein PK466_14715 [Thermotogota bacterium]|nr:hypothetical protein [Thermotogota bacterium]